MSKRRHAWNDDLPIYRQITDIIIHRIIDQVYPEGELLPSVRGVAQEFDVSPLTAAKVFQELDKESITTKIRGIGAEVSPNARARLLARERDKFLNEEWPNTLERIKRLDLDPADLLANK